MRRKPSLAEVDFIERGEAPRREIVKPPPIPQPPPQKKRRKPLAPKAGYEGRFAPGNRVVDDPYEPGAKIVVPANVRHDPLARMLDRGEIDEAQHKAGEIFRGLLERAGERGAGAMDTTKEPVDGLPAVVDVSETRMKAARALAEVKAVLGFQTYRLVRGVVSDGLNGSLIAQATDYEVNREFVMKTVRDGLEQLAIFWHFVSDPKHTVRAQAMRASIAEMPQWTDPNVDAIIFIHQDT